jgi:hypothetical protein
MLDLPRLSNDTYKDLLSEAKEIIKSKETNNEKLKTISATFNGSNFTPELDLQIELDRLAIQKFINHRIQTINKCKSDLDTSKFSNEFLNNPLNVSSSKCENNDQKKYNILFKSLNLDENRNNFNDEDNNLLNRQNTFISRMSTKFTETSKSSAKKKIK